MKKNHPSIELKVKEALPKDVGRGLARLDPDDMQTLGIEVGDIIAIEGKRRAPAKAMPCYSGERGKRIIQIDGLCRKNAQIGLDEKVRAVKAASAPARKITLGALSPSVGVQRDQDTQYLGSLLAGLAVSSGDTVRASLFGSGSRDFTVANTQPDGVVVVTLETLIRFDDRAAGATTSSAIAYEDIGGLSSQLQRIREMIELPLRYPQVFERLGVEAPKGVLLHGPPGTGKTLIARAVANETEAYFRHVSGPEIMGKFYGESEGRLREIFEDARKHAPAIIFIDEIDAIAPKRGDMGGEKQVERRVVAQLLALLDGLESRGHVIVIGATNIPNTLDPALRRPGRFDREITIPIPDRRGRHEILQIHSRGMPLAEDFDLDRVADITHGFVGADLQALVREAAMIALRIILPNINFAMAEIPYDTLMKLEVTMDHLLEAMKEVEPSAIREFFVETPDVSWDDVGGLESVKQTLKEAVEWPLKYADIFRQTHCAPPKGILLIGVPGTGKTLLAKAVAKQSGVNFIAVKGPELVSRFVGESERAIREIFKIARRASPTVLFFDEIDSLLPRRGAADADARVAERIVSQFLTEMDGIEDLKGVVVLAATNRPDIIDPACLRGGRFDFIIELPLPDEKTREAIFHIHTRLKPLAPDVNIADLARLTDGKTGSDIEGYCRKAALAAIREFLAKRARTGAPRIAAKHFKEAMGNT